MRLRRNSRFGRTVLTVLMARDCGGHLQLSELFIQMPVAPVLQVTQLSMVIILLVGTGNKVEQAKSSTWRELAAVARTLESVSVLSCNSRVKWFTDNQNVVRIIKVGSRLPELQVLALSIFKTAFANNIYLEPEWLPREENRVADEFSRIIDVDDWMINPSIFAWVDYFWGPHTVDRFANCHNAQLDCFNSRFWVARSEAIDAFTVNWANENNWLCPPIHLVCRVLRHVTVLEV